MTCKERRRAKRTARDIKNARAIIEGKARYAPYEPRKRMQPNRKGGCAPTEEDSVIMAGRAAGILRVILPGILAMISDIADPRDTSRTEHTLPAVMLFGIIMFLSQSRSRRKANEEVAGEGLLDLVGDIVPGAALLPHADTLARLLSDIGQNELETRYNKLLKEFIASIQFRALNPGKLVVACDGTQKFTRGYEWDKRALRQNVGVEGRERHYVYLLESVLIMENGITLPLLTEFLENDPDDFKSADAGECGGSAMAKKQDCETKAFRRLAKRLVKLLGTGTAILLLDGIYASGPVISLCKSYGWDYMITFKEGSLPSVWEDFAGLQKMDDDNCLIAERCGRKQEYRWSNGHYYTYGNNNAPLLLNVVTCTETWYEEHIRSGGIPESKSTRYAWLSSVKISEKNVIERCMLGRSRWRIENGFHIEKHRGYSYGHCFSYNWVAMQGFHCLMKYGVFINMLLLHSAELVDYTNVGSDDGFIDTLWGLFRFCGWPECPDNGIPFGGSKRRRRKSIFPELAA
ncbi:MAG: transposase family protein [Oscillospiraceae bacterium]|nr:transposase family protein [Oscillospiraceae bacterium]